MIILRQKNYTSLKPDFIGNLELIADQANNAFPNEKGVGMEVVYQKNSRLGIRCEIYFGWDDVDYVHVSVMSNNQMYDEYGQKKLNEQELKDLLLTSISGMQKENIPGTKNKLKFLYDQIKALPTRGSVTQKSYSEKADKRRKKNADKAAGSVLALGAGLGGLSAALGANEAEWNHNFKTGKELSRLGEEEIKSAHKANQKIRYADEAIQRNRKKFNDIKSWINSNEQMDSSAKKKAHKAADELFDDQVGKWQKSKARAAKSFQNKQAKLVEEAKRLQDPKLLKKARLKGAIKGAALPVGLAAAGATAIEASARSKNKKENKS